MYIYILQTASNADLSASVTCVEQVETLRLRSTCTNDIIRAHLQQCTALQSKSNRSLDNHLALIKFMFKLSTRIAPQQGT